MIGVNFWECNAFCNWLARYLTERDWWEGKASACRQSSSGNTQHGAGVASLFPWGAESPLDPLRAHVRDSENADCARTCAVGLFPFARWPDGPLDMTGNVWEWTSSSVTRYDSAEATPEDKAMRITRGGSWLTQEPEAIELTFRTFDPPFNAYEDLGMRVIAVNLP